MAEIPSNGAIAVLTSGDLASVLVEAQCGRLASLACLCDPAVLDAARLLLERYSRRERDVILKTICGCGIPVAPPQNVPTTVIVPPPPITVQPPPPVAPPPVAPPPPPVVPPPVVVEVPEPPPPACDPYNLPIERSLP